jgi:hypothetical protein
MNNGTASKMSVGRFRELTKVVVGALPDDLSEDDSRYWEQNGKELKNVLRQALSRNRAQHSILSVNVAKYAVQVNYDLATHEARKAGNYVWSNSEIDGEFPSAYQGNVQVEINLVHFGTTMSANDVLAGLDALGLRPAVLREFLAFGAQFPELQSTFPIVELGSTWERPAGLYRVACLFAENSRRFLDLSWIDCAWEEHYRFAAVRK